MADIAKNVIKTIVILIVSIGIGAIPTYIIAESSHEIAGTSMPFFLWGVFTIIIAISIRVLFNRRRGTRGTWGSPEETRSQVVNTPQFVGRFDRSKGLLESTARMVETDVFSFQTTWMYKAKEMKLIRFRGELLDQNGSTLETVPVEIKGERRKWVGNITNGDRIKVSGKIEDDGILHAENAFNYSTNSWVGER